jgi:hypothetical protein
LREATAPIGGGAGELVLPADGEFFGLGEPAQEADASRGRDIARLLGGSAALAAGAFLLGVAWSRHWRAF